MSLVSYASPWNNEETSNKKRTSTMRKTYKRQPINNDDNFDNQTEAFTEYSESPPPQKNAQNDIQPSLEDMQNLHESKTSRVNDLLNQMSNTSIENNKMGEFKPISPPTLNVKKDMDKQPSSRQYVPTAPSYHAASNSLKSTPEQMQQYKANDQSAEIYGNYNKSYDRIKSKAAQPYYSNMGIGNGNGNGLDDKMMEKINYMIHLLEEQQHEKTNNITEEFLLYTFLGVFVIYVVDSFARTGKYIR